MAVPRHGDTPDKINNSCQTRADGLNAKLSGPQHEAKPAASLEVLPVRVGAEGPLSPRRVWVERAEVLACLWLAVRTGLLINSMDTTSVWPLFRRVSTVLPAGLATSGLKDLCP